MTNWLLQHLSYLGIILVLIACGVGLPVPEEIPVLAAAVLSHPLVGGSVMKWYLAFPVCLFGALCGDCVTYAVGYRWGRNILSNRKWFMRFLHPEWEVYTERLLHRHGLKILFAARFLVGLRSPIYLAAGILRLSFIRFAIYDFVSAIPVVGITFALGYWFAPSIDEVRRDLSFAKYLILVVVAVIGCAMLISWYVKRRYFGAALAPAQNQTAERVQEASSGSAAQEPPSPPS